MLIDGLYILRIHETTWDTQVKYLCKNAHTQHTHTYYIHSTTHDDWFRQSPTTKKKWRKLSNFGHVCFSCRAFLFFLFFSFIIINVSRCNQKKKKKLWSDVLWLCGQLQLLPSFTSHAWCMQQQQQQHQKQVLKQVFDFISSFFFVCFFGMDGIVYNSLLPCKTSFSPPSSCSKRVHFCVERRRKNFDDVNIHTYERTLLRR